MNNSVEILAFQPDEEQVIYNRLLHPHFSITVANNSESHTLCVIMYTLAHKSVPIWSDENEGGLAPGKTRTYFVGSNINKIAIRGMDGAGICSYKCEKV